MISSALWWLFLGLGPVVYWLLPERLRAPALTTGSFALLTTFAPLDIAGMAAVAAAVYFAHGLKDRGGGGAAARLGALGRTPFLVLAVLIYFFWNKYLPAIALALSGRESVLNLVIPLGVSYFSFKLLHYTIDRGRNSLPAHGFWDFASFMFLAPIFTAGPIERFEHYLAHRESRFRFEFVAEGSIRIAQGLVKKFILGVVAMEAIDTLTDQRGALSVLMAPEDASPFLIWRTLLLLLLYVYLDFSAYSDIAIGSSRLFGLRIMENFNWPFLATTLQQFWQRWHMTLATWVRVYIYMSVVALTRNPYAASIVTFAAMGAWHAAWPAHWVLWGLWHGLGLVALTALGRYRSKRKIKPPRFIAWRILAWATTIGWVALGGSFTALYGHAPISAPFRVIAAAFGLS